MSSNKERVSYLFNRYYQKTATEAERKELFLLMNRMSDEELSLLTEKSFTSGNNAIFETDDTKTLANLSKILGGSLQEEKPRRTKIISLWGRIAVAASILLVISSAIYFSQDKKGETTAANTPKTEMATDALPGSDKAILTLGDGSTVMLDDAGNGVLANQGGIEVKKTADGQLVYTIKSSGAATAEIQTNKIATPRGGQFQVVLPDGSKAWLNAASSISFPTAFTQGKREVTMTGEVYFEVAKNRLPFIVNAAKGAIQVLGTHFNIMAYEDEKEMETTLVEGSVKLTSGNSAQLLKPGQQAASAHMGDIKMNANVDVDEVIAWKTGLFQFKDAGIETVMRQLSRWYDVDVTYEGKLPQKRLNGKISRNVKASEVLNMLSYTGINFSIEGKKIRVMP